MPALVRLFTVRVGLITLACLLAVIRVPAARAETDVWIDTDPSLGLPFHDADDGFALVQAFGDPARLRVRGISVSYGNTGLARAEAITRDLVRRCGGPAPVFAGAAGPGDLGKRTPASDALLVASAGRRLTYLALGPLTNLAAALRRQPELAGRLDRVVFLGGRRPGERLRVGRWLPYEFHDANFDKDPAAAGVVLRSGVPLTLVPARLAFPDDLLLTPADLRKLGREGGPTGRWLQARASAWLRLWQGGFALRGGPLFDSLAVLAAARPELMTEERTTALISAERDRPALATPEAELARAGARRRFYLLIGGATTGGEPVSCVTRIAEGAKAAMLEDLLRAGDGRPAASQYKYRSGSVKASLMR